MMRLLFVGNANGKWKILYTQKRLTKCSLRFT